jgi:hypothetical protein
VIRAMEDTARIHAEIQAYYGGMTGAHHRYRSWEHCYRYEHSKDSKDGTLESYVLDLADNHKALFVPLLGRLLPLQINARTQQTTKIVYKTVAARCQFAENLNQSSKDKGARVS